MSPVATVSASSAFAACLEEGSPLRNGGGGGCSPWKSSTLGTVSPLSSPFSFQRFQCSPTTLLVEVRSSCRCKDSFVCSACSCTLADDSGGVRTVSSTSTCNKLDPAANVGAIPRVIASANSIMPSLKLAPKVGVAAQNTLSQTSSLEFPRTVLAERDDNRLPQLSRNGAVNLGSQAAVVGVGDIRNFNVGNGQNSVSLNSKEGNLQGPLYKVGDKSNGHYLGKSGCSPLKRKRPPTLDIPLCAAAMPETRKDCDQGTENLDGEMIEEIIAEGSYYGLSCKRGRRHLMEDTHRAMPDLQGNKKQAFFGVFDGHGGRMAADFVAQNLSKNIVDALSNSGEGEDYIERAIRHGYLATDAEFLLKQSASGACSVTALLKDGYLVVANAGDCRAVLSRAGKSEALTSDHRAGREDERTRIESLGGYVDCFSGAWRVQGVLAVSRGFGDMDLKEWICAEPDVKKIPITPDCEFLILASDGLWDKVSNQEAVDCARHWLGLKNKTASSINGVDSVSGKAQACAKTDIVGLDSNPREMGKAMGIAGACKKLVEMAVNRRGQDDISVLIVLLPYFCRDDMLD